MSFSTFTCRFHRRKSLSTDWHVSYAFILTVVTAIYFIFSIEINAYHQWIKVTFSQVKWYRINSQVSDTIYIFTAVKMEKTWCKCILKRFISRKLVTNDALDVDILYLFQWRHILRWSNARQADGHSRRLPLVADVFVIHSLKGQALLFSICKLRLHPLNTMNHTKLMRNDREKVHFLSDIWIVSFS